MALKRRKIPSEMSPEAKGFSDRAVGCLMGLAVGDALGVPREGAPVPPVLQAEELQPVLEMTAVPGFPPGTWSDDTAQALCIAESLVERNGFDPADVAARFVEWFKAGGLGIGRTTLVALEAMAAGADWADASRSAHETLGGRTAGNAAVMRCAPVAVYFADDDEEITAASADSARVTHWDPLAGECAAAVNLVIARCLRGATDGVGVVAEVAFICDEHAQRLHPAERATSPGMRVAAALREAATGRLADLDPASGFSLETLRTAAHFFMGAESFEGPLSECVALGGDADTNGAVLGAMLGARFGAGGAGGEAGIPERWSSALQDAGRIEAVAAKLADSAAARGTKG